jgi:hypothetical protein
MHLQKLSLLCNSFHSDFLYDVSAFSEETLTINDPNSATSLKSDKVYLMGALALVVLAPVLRSKT